MDYVYGSTTVNVSKGFPLMLKSADCKFYVRSAILYGSEACRLKDCEIRVSRWTVGSLLSAMCGV